MQFWKYVFAEVYSEKLEISEKKNKEILETDSLTQDLKITDKLKLDLLNDQIEIYTNTNVRLLNENKDLEKKINDLNTELSKSLNTISSQKNIIEKNKIDKVELEFLKLNLIYSKKCKKPFSNPKGFKFWTKKYRECVINKGKLQW